MYKCIQFDIEAMEQLKLGKFERDANNWYSHSYIPSSVIKGAIVWNIVHKIGIIDNKILNDIAWFKPNASPNLSCRFFTASHETLIWARKELIHPKTGKLINTKHKFNYDLMKNGNWPEDFLKKPNLQMRSVWSMGTPKPAEKKFGKHPTQKPIDLLVRIVMASTEKGDLVLDPFTGSSTTGLACALNGRKFIGIDLEKKYLELSVKRYKDLSL